jgi:hypothetical protein
MKTIHAGRATINFEASSSAKSNLAREAAEGASPSRKERKNMNLKTAIPLLAIALVLYAPSFFAADTNTNIIPSLTIAGQTYTNVEIGTVTGSRVTIFYDGGGQRVAISNLPPDLQQRLHYDPEAVSAQARLEALVQEEANRQKTILGPVQTVKLIKILPDGFFLIDVNIGEVEGAFIHDHGGQVPEAFIDNLPLDIANRVLEIRKAEAEVALLATQYQAAQARIGSGGGSFYLGGYARNQQESAELALRAGIAAEEAHWAEINRAAAAAAHEALQKAQSRLKDLQALWDSHNIILACPSAYIMRRIIRQWEYRSTAIYSHESSPPPVYRYQAPPAPDYRNPFQAPRQ